MLSQKMENGRRSEATKTAEEYHRRNIDVKMATL